MDKDQAMMHVLMKENDELKLEIGRLRNNSVIIPDNATNVDMIKAMFPNAEYNEHERFIRIWLKSDGNDYVFELPLSFCNSPYRKE